MTHRNDRKVSPGGSGSCEHPLSFAQERLWFLEQLEPETSVYNLAWLLEIKGPLSVSTLQHSLDTIVGRHEILRTTYAAHDGVPFQRVHDPQPAPFRVLDLRAHPPPTREGLRKAALAEAAATPFQMDELPMLRGLLVHDGDHRHTLMLITHHIAADGWSQHLINQELSAIYGALDMGRPWLLSEPLQYASHVRSEREGMASPRHRKALLYWTRQLASLPESLSIPFDRPRSVRPNYEAGSVPVEIFAELYSKLQTLANELHVTPFMVLAACWAELLGRYAREDDIAIGFPIAGRLSPETEKVVGCFVNTLVLRVKLEEATTFRELVQQVRNTCLDAYDNQQIPFERIVTELQPNREMNQSPLFQVMFAFGNLPTNAIRLGSASAHSRPYARRVAKFDLRLDLCEANGRCTGRLDYRKQLYDPRLIRQIAHHFVHLLTEAVEAPARPIHTLSLCLREDALALESAETGPLLDVPAATLDDVLCRQALRIPESIAITDRVRSLTYAQLDREASRIASALERAGVEQGDRVGLCIPESTYCLAALFGILRAGAAYVPMNPYDPARRLADYAAAAQLRVIISNHDSQEHLQSVDIPICSIGAMGIETERSESASCHPRTTPDDLAYVLFTSGSTGRPKAVAVTHRSAVQYARGSEVALGFTDGATFLWVQPLTADTSLTTLLGALFCGGCVQAVHPGDRVDVHAISQYTRDQRPDVLKIAPTHLSSLLEASPDPLSLLPGRLLIFGGETLPWELTQRVRRLDPDLRLVNHYGPTETTVGVTWYGIPSEGREGGGLVPIGRPFPNVLAYVVDRHGQRCPNGIPGELWIGGPYLARGYLFDDVATDEAFTENPFDSAVGERIYRTGDLVLRDDQGNLRFLGRIDDQVKIRGFRVEPAETQARLVALPGIADAVVVPHSVDNGPLRLVAYYVPQKSAEVTPHILAGYLSEILPTHMIPSVFVRLDALPRLPHGKVDRKALPEPSLQGIGTSNGHDLPQNEFERRLVTSWEEALAKQPIGRNDDFFALGGHSLLALRLLSRLERETGMSIPVRVLFEMPTVAGLARFLQNES